MEDPNAARYCLPSISSLIEAADEGTGRERLQIDPQLLPQDQERSPIVSNPTDPLPPTPPLRPGSSFDTRHQSPTTLVISGSDRQAPASAINDVEANAQHQMNYPPIPQDRPLRPLQGPVSPYAASSYGSVGDVSTASYQGSPVEGNAGSAVPYQRPLPSGFPPPSSYDEPSGQYISHATPAWQHHHHFPHSASTPYPPNQDRYICGTCNKAFSRPSSLKIHTHSHTGEKPWKCQIPGCGKTFSVRSNMKRHEKGCHGDGGFQNGDLGRVSPESAS